MPNRRSFLKAAGLVAGATSMAPRTLFGDMPGDKRIAQPSNVVEMLSRRSEHGKLFKLPSRNQFRFLGSVGAIHWRNEEADRWRDIDCTWQEHAGLYKVGNVGYRVSFDPRRMVLTYSSRKGNGELRLRLVDIDGREPRMSRVYPFHGGDRFRLIDVADGVDLVVVCRGDAPEIYRKFADGVRPALTWEVEDRSDGRLSTNLGKLAGWDNHDMLYRQGERQRRRAVEIEYETTPTVAGAYRVTERLTGRTKVRDPETRVARWADDMVGQVFLDVTVNEDTAAAIDDGNGYDPGASEVWDSNNDTVFFSTSYDPAWLWQTVDIPQGATINSASITVYVHAADATATAAMHGQNVDSAESWAQGSGNGPERMARTTASITFNGFSATGSTARTITTLVQEIVNRAGWSSGGNLRVGCRDATAGSSCSFRAYDYYGATDAGKLASDYTSGGTPASKKQLLIGVGDE